MERKLATIRIIDSIRPIEGADLIELASVGGWNVVVAKEVGHKVGDWVVYCEVDSFLPIRPEYEFLRKSSYKKMGDEEGFRLKTVKLRGVLSQGLILPLKEVQLPNKDLLKEGMEVTKELGIVKYEPPIPAELAGKVKGPFPSWGKKTDQERCQNLTEEISDEIKKGSFFEITIKLDGASMSIGHFDGDIVVCSRNLSLDLEQEKNTFIDVFKSLGVYHKIKEYGNILISGELCGPGIQGNNEKLKHHKFYVFDVFDVDKQTYLPSETRINIVESLGLEHVPILHKSVKLTEIGLNSIQDILKYSEGPSLNSEVREGLVFKKIDGTFSFKAISNSFLLKYD
jgi:RNA ligase (TIGR02306 family)